MMYLVWYDHSSIWHEINLKPMAAMLHISNITDPAVSMHKITNGINPNPNTVNFLNIRTPQKIVVITLKFEFVALP